MQPKLSVNTGLAQEAREAGYLKHMICDGLDLIKRLSQSVAIVWVAFEGSRIDHQTVFASYFTF